MIRILAIVALAMCFAAPAEAHHRHHGHHKRSAPAGIVVGLGIGLQHMLQSMEKPQDSADTQRRFPDILAPPAYERALEGRGRRHFRDARPARWCGWFMRQVMGVSDTAYNLAANWKNYGRPAGGPGIGVIVVWPHHVGRIVGQDSNGQWLVNSGNDGHAVRTRPRSLAGAIAFRT